MKVPVLFTHHFRTVEEDTGRLIGALSALQASRARDLITEAGCPVDYRSFPGMGHQMPQENPERFARTIVDRAEDLPAESGSRK